MIKIKSHNSGFTLIEILVVATIIMMLASITIYSSLSQTSKLSRDARRKADIENLRSALELYRSNNGYYPSGAYSDLTTALVNGSPQYIKVVPIDPQDGRVINGATYGYTYTPSAGCNNTTIYCSTYTLKGNLETTSDTYYSDPLGSIQATPTPIPVPCAESCLSSTTCTASGGTQVTGACSVGEICCYIPAAP